MTAVPGPSASACRLIAVARAVCAGCGRPLTATSANVSGEPATADPDEVERALGDRIDLLLDAGRTPGGPPSTIVDVHDRAAARWSAPARLPWEEIQAWLSTRSSAARG